MAPVEQWKSIPGFPCYDASNHGRVRSYYRRGRAEWRVADTPQRILKQSIGKYPFVCLRDANRNGQPRRIHSLVMLAFVGPCPNGLEVCHNDGDRQNNFLTNLRYDTHTSNMQDAFEHGVINKLTTQDIIDIRNRRAGGATYNDIACNYSVSIPTISSICQGNSYRYIGGPQTTGHKIARKLSDSDIVTIRQLLADGNIMQTTIAERYNVSDSLISRIKHDTRRTNIKGIRSISR